MKILAAPGMQVGDLNPYTRLLYEHIQELGHEVEEFTFARAFTKRHDILHFHWPEYFVAQPSDVKAYVGSTLILLAAMWGRVRGAKIIWTVHNLGSHENRRPRLEKWFWRTLYWFLDGYIALSKRGEDDARVHHQRLNRLPSFVIPHGHYRNAYAKSVSKSVARDWLNVPRDGKVVCFFGGLSAYKGVADLIATFTKLPDPDLVLLIAGESSAENREDWLSAARADSRIRLHIGFVPPRQVQFYLLAADLVALPFREVWNSGSALLALSFDRPILVPQCPAFMELQHHVGKSWVRMYSGQLTSEVLKDEIEWSREKREQRHAPLEHFEWPQIAKRTVAAYEHVLASRQKMSSRYVPASPTRVVPNQTEQSQEG